MKRSNAPSQVRKRSVPGGMPPLSKNGGGVDGRKQGSEIEGSQTIEVLPLFDFLSIPNNLKKQFTIPTGCKITKESIALRKTKVLGTGYNKTPFLRPGGLKAFVPVTGFVPGMEEGDENDDGADELPTSASVPPYERLVLWRDPDFLEDKEDEEEKAGEIIDENNENGGIKEIATAADKPKRKQHIVEVVPELASKLRPHQREGVQFLFECTMGLRGFDGEGCILADDMGLGKTLMSITLLWTLLNQGIDPRNPSKAACRKVVVVCPTSLVGNWDNEIKKWVPGEQCVTFAVKTDPKVVIRNFVNYRGKQAVLIISYETQRRYSSMFKPSKLKSLAGSGSCCDLLICDEAHKLKNAESGLAKSLRELPARKRVLLSGTPMQNELGEFFNMVDFCNPGVIGSAADFRRTYERPILESREPGCPNHKREKAAALQNELSTIVNEFILKRGNILNAQHLPPKLVQFVCCRLTDEQQSMYKALIDTKNVRHLQSGKQTETLQYIRHLINVCSHPQLLENSFQEKLRRGETDELLLNALKFAKSRKKEGRYCVCILAV